MLEMASLSEIFLCGFIVPDSCHLWASGLLHRKVEDNEVGSFFI